MKTRLLMRIHAVVAVAIAVLPGPARAQIVGEGAPAIAATAPAPGTADRLTSTGLIDVGGRSSSIRGDGARYERYRDLGDGMFLETLRTQLHRQNWFLDVAADHVARRDARYGGTLTRPGIFTAWGRWDQIPMLMSRTTQTLYETTRPGVLRLDDDIQKTLQGTVAAQQPGVLSSFVNARAATFTAESRRHIGSGGVEYMPDVHTTLSVDAKRTHRTGTIPYGATFGFSNAVEVPLSIDHQLTDVTASAERAQGPLLLRAGYTGSWFSNAVPALVWDNPYRLNDGVGLPSQGQSALPSDNAYVNVNGSVSIKLPARSRATAYVAFGALSDRGTPLLPHTVNTALPAIPLDRPTLNGRARTKATTLSFTSRPTTRVNVAARYRYYDYDNRTPTYTNTSRIGYDTSVQALATPSLTERYGGARQSLVADLTYRRWGATLGAGFTRSGADYNHRIFESSTETTSRLILNAFSSRWFSLRSKYEHGNRRGKGLDTAELAAFGEQPGLRTFDVADRNRELFTLTGAFTPTGSLSFSVSSGAGEDRFPHSQFGLVNARHQIYSLGLDAAPSNRITLGISYDAEDYRTLQWSRQANPGAQFTDSSRDWSADGHDRVHSVLANLEVSRIAEKLDVRLGYDFNRGRSLYVYGTGSVIDRTLPEGSDPVASTLSPPTQLPPVLGELTRGTFDATYALTARVALSATYWYEQYRVDDFALDAEAIPRINLPTALLIGYQYLPYTAHTGWVRLIVHW